MRPLIPHLCLLLSLTPALAHDGAPAAGSRTAAPPAAQPPAGRATETQPRAIRTEAIGDGVFCLSGLGGNVGVVVTDGGLVVVDDQYRDTAPALLEAVRAVADRPIRWLVNTHHHGDHTGGNPLFGTVAEIVAHRNVRARLLDDPDAIRRSFPARIEALQAEIEGLGDPADPYRAALEKDLGLMRFLLDGAAQGPPPAAALPVLTYEGGVTLWPGGREIRVLHVGPGHTDGDSIVHVPAAGVLHLGDLMFNGSVPFVDVRGGGSVLGFIANLERVLEIVPAGTRIIPGHGPVTDVPAVRRYRDFLLDLRRQVEEAVAAGRSLPETVRLVHADQYPDIRPGFRTLGNLAAALYGELRAP